MPISSGKGETILRTSKVLVFLLITLLIFSSSGFASSQLILGTFAGPPLSNKDRNGFYDLVITEAFRRIDYRIKIVDLPAERSLINANNGITDGDFVRVSGLKRLYPNLIRVPEKIVDFEFVAFSRNARISTNNWDGLRPYDVAIVRGWKLLEENIIGARSLTLTDNQDQLFNLLKKGRADVVVYSGFEGAALLDSMEIKDAVALAPPLAVRAMYLYLNRRHRNLVVPLVNVLREMKADGTYDEIKARSLGPYLKGKNHAG